jgi:hypothetical protein
MYDADEQAFYDEQDAAYRERHPDEFEVRDSGKKAVYSDGNQRDDPAGKPRFDLLYPRGMEYEETLLYRVAMHYMRGGQKYGDRNWEKSSTEESLLAHETALHRHFTKFALGIEDGEDHAAAIVWNLQAILYTRWRLKQRIDASVPPVAVNSGNTPTRQETLDKLMGRETAEHSAELDKIQDEATDSGSYRPGVLNDMPCIDCKQKKCKHGEGRCPDCQRTNQTAAWQEKARKIGGPCPDGGACHHGCVEQKDWPCYRVLTCGPLSGVMPGDRWPAAVVQHNNDMEASRLLAERERNSQ